MGVLGLGCLRDEKKRCKCRCILQYMLGRYNSSDFVTREVERVCSLVILTWDGGFIGYLLLFVFIDMDSALNR